MSEKLWSAVDDFLDDQLVKPDPVFDEIIERSQAAGLPAISVTASQGKFLQLLARAIKAQRILEIGTLGGYSAVWMAKGLPSGGVLVTLELEPRHAEVARQNVELAGVADRVEVMVGAAATSLAKLARDRRPPFDLVFIDADKGGYPTYFEWSMKLTRPGALIVADNVVRDGKVIDRRTRDSNTLGIRRFMEAVASEPRATATAMQTVGSKGYDGLALILVT